LAETLAAKLQTGRSLPDPPNNPNLALEDGAFYSHPERPQTLVFFDRAHRIRFRHVACGGFAAELRQRFEALAAQPAAPAPAADAPVLFLSYATEDHAAAEELADRLRSEGLRVWLDRQNLRGGDRWELLIPDVTRRRLADPGAGARPVRGAVHPARRRGPPPVRPDARGAGRRAAPGGGARAHPRRRTVANIKFEEGDMPAASAAYEQALTICERLFNSDPSNLQWQIDVIEFLGDSTQPGLVDADTAAKRLRRALEMLEPLESAGKLHGESRDWPDIYRQRLKSLKP
jgi:hypothetical protein